MGQQKIEGIKPDYKPLIMEYKDGLTIEDMDDFILATRSFVTEAKLLYGDEKVHFYFLPESMVKMMMDGNDAV